MCAQLGRFIAFTPTVTHKETQVVCLELKYTFYCVNDLWYTLGLIFKINSNRDIEGDTECLP